MPSVSPHHRKEDQVTNIVDFPRNRRLDQLMRDHRLAGWYGEIIHDDGAALFRMQDGGPSSPVGLIWPDDSWELRSPGQGATLAAGKNYQWTTQGFPTPELAEKIQSRGARAPRSPKKAPKPKECFRCGSIARTQPVGVRADDGAVKTIHACPQHLAEAFAESKPKQESTDAIRELETALQPEEQKKGPGTNP